MFKNKKIELRLVKDEAGKHQIEDSTGHRLTPEEIAAYSALMGKKLVTGIVIVMAANVALAIAGHFASKAIDNHFNA